MSLPTPFAYPIAPHSRQHGPFGYDNYRTYKPFLRDEFAFRCVYCLERETWYPSQANAFSADHFVPKVLNPSRICDYDNLVYACSRCNALKRENVISLDPTLVALGEHLRVQEDGTIESATEEGKKLIALLDLADGPAMKVRTRTLMILRAKRERPEDATIDRIYLDWFGYPADLPDLTKLQPPGNARLDGIKASHHARKVRGELPAVY